MTTTDPKTYMVSAGLVPNALSGLEHFLRNDHRIEAYWNYLPGVYFVKSNFTAEQLSYGFEPYFGGASFIVVEVNPFNMNGRMPKGTWGWFYEKPDPLVRALAADPPPRGPFAPG